MAAHALVDVTCPHCSQTFVTNAKLVRPGGNAYCPDCETLFVLDAGDDRMRETLLAAKAARHRRKDRVREMRERWAEPAPRPAELPQTATRPVLLSDVLKVLDQLLDNLDSAGRRAS